MAFIFETQRLSVREITPSDAEDLAFVLADPLVMKHSTVGVHSDLQINDFIKNCQQLYRINGYGHWIIYNNFNEFVGVCGLNKHQVGDKELVHINYRLATSQQGKGYAVESTQGVLSFAKDALALSWVYALIEPDNVNSVKVANRTGFSFIESSVFRGFDIDIYQHSL
ncbi:GNAT family N-acetyltransferase [Pseudoalteromonas neustonica]|uniref:GNAT family N-acetyltransferase n=1 Tax=Pseudoalteromonas neustonica TaxID=1840331 RepID=A0ABU9TXA1_9GAMM